MRAFHSPDRILGMDRMVYLQQSRRIYRAIHHGHSMCGIMCDCSYSIYKGIQERWKAIVAFLCCHLQRNCH